MSIVLGMFSATTLIQFTATRQSRAFQMFLRMFMLRACKFFGGADQSFRRVLSLISYYYQVHRASIDNQTLFLTDCNNAK